MDMDGDVDVNVDVEMDTDIEMDMDMGGDMHVPKRAADWEDLFYKNQQKYIRLTFTTLEKHGHLEFRTWNTAEFCHTSFGIPRNSEKFYANSERSLEVKNTGGIPYSQYSMDTYQGSKN